MEEGGTYSFIEYDDDDTIVVVSLVNPATPLARRSWVRSRLCGPWVTRFVHSWPLIVVGGLRGLWSSFAESCCRC